MVTPLDALQVSGSITSGSTIGGEAGGILNLATRDSGTSGEVRFWEGGGLVAKILSTMPNGNSGSLSFLTAATNSAPATRMLIDNAGNVGIGNISPAYKLDVSGLGHFTGLVDASNFVATSSTATSTIAGGLSVAGSGGLTVLQNGNVGIGTGAPGKLLTVGGTTRINGATNPTEPSLSIFGTGGNVYNNAIVSTITNDNSYGMRMRMGNNGFGYLEGGRPQSS